MPSRRLKELRRLVRHKTTQAAKRAIARVCSRHDADGPGDDIFLFFTPRSGSTWLTELIYAEPGMRFVEDPLIWRNLPGQYRALLSQGTRLIERADGVDEAMLRDYLERVRRAEINTCGPWNVFDRRFNRRTDRQIIKLSNGSAILGWFQANFPGRDILQLRHPIATALSQVRWGIGASPRNWALDASCGRDVWLSATQQQVMRDAIASNDLLDMRVANWCYENYPALQHARQDPSIAVVFYEDMILHPQRFVDRLCTFCDLQDRDRIAENITRPSKTTPRGQQSSEDEAARHQRCEKWRSEIDFQTEARLMDYVERFGITVYGQGESVLCDTAGMNRLI